MHTDGFFDYMQNLKTIFMSLHKAQSVHGRGHQRKQAKFQRWMLQGQWVCRLSRNWECMGCWLSCCSIEQRSLRHLHCLLYAGSEQSSPLGAGLGYPFLLVRRELLQCSINVCFRSCWHRLKACGQTQRPAVESVRQVLTRSACMKMSIRCCVGMPKGRRHTCGQDRLFVR